MIYHGIRGGIFMKKIAVLILTIVFIYVCIPPLEVNAANNGSWKVNSKGWWYEYEDGSYAKNEFVTINGKTYFFNKYGYMITGWKKFTHEEDPNILPSSSYWCYFNSDGSMAKSEFIQGYYLEESGHWRENEGKYTWVKHYYDENTYDWHYVSKRDIDSFSDDQANGRPFGCTGWTKIDKKYYYFDDFQGNMLSNCYVGNMVDGFYWLNKNGQWSYKGRLYKIPSDYVFSMGTLKILWDGFRKM